MTNNLWIIFIGMDGYEMDGRELRVDYARHERPASFGGGRDGSQMQPKTERQKVDRWPRSDQIYG